MVSFKPFESSISPGFDPEPNEDAQDMMLDPQAGRTLPLLKLPPISAKPWFVVATKADSPDTQENFSHLQDYLTRVQSGDEEHPSGKQNAWRRDIYAVPVSALKKEGVQNIPEIVLKLLGG